jgi:hypothetical protein
MIAAYEIDKKESQIMSLDSEEDWSDIKIDEVLTQSRLDFLPLIPVEYEMSESDLTMPVVCPSKAEASTASYSVDEGSSGHHAVLPHYVTIDFQGCELNINFYDTSKPPAPHEVIKPEMDNIEFDNMLKPETSISKSENALAEPTEPASEDVLISSPPSLPEPPEPPTSDPIWFA